MVIFFKSFLKEIECSVPQNQTQSFNNHLQQTKILIGRQFVKEQLMLSLSIKCRFKNEKYIGLIHET